MPLSVVKRAEQVLKDLEAAHRAGAGIADGEAMKSDITDVKEPVGGMQLSMFQLDDPVLIQIRDEVKGLDIDSLTPLEALNKLNEIKKIAGI